MIPSCTTEPHSHKISSQDDAWAGQLLFDAWAGRLLFNAWLSPLCLQWFVWFFDYSLVLNSRDELGVLVCLLVCAGGVV